MEKLGKLLAKRIKEVRKQKSLRQEDMEGFGFNYRYYQKIESGNANITLNTIERIAKAFGIDASELFTMPLHPSKEVNELNALIREFIKKGDKKAVRKLKLIIEEVL